MLGCMAATFFIASCSDETTPTADKNYYPLTVGNTWTYDVVETEDTTGTVREIPESKYTTTTTVDASLTYEGRSANRLVNKYDKVDMPQDTTYISKSGSQIYTYIALSAGDIGGLGSALNFGSRWMLTVDPNQTTWTMLDTTITGLTISIPNLGDVPAKAVIKVTGSKGGTSSMTVGTQAVTAQEFSTVISLNMVLTTPLGEQTVPVSLTNKTYFAEDIGIIKSEAIPSTITFPLNLIPPTHLNGDRQTLKVYTVVK